jgi:hypothetical protein
MYKCVHLERELYSGSKLVVWGASYVHTVLQWPAGLRMRGNGRLSRKGVVLLRHW